MALSRTYDDRMEHVANASQLACYKLYCEGYAHNDIAEKLDRKRSSISRSLRRLEAMAIKRGVIHNHTIENGVAAGYKLKGTSTLYDGDGKACLTWVKTREDVQSAEDAVKEMIECLKDEVPAKQDLVPVPAFDFADLMAVLPVPDLHLGMYAWEEECGANYDSDICEQRIRAGADRVLDALPACKVLRVEELGDLFHSDDESKATKRHGNRLDTDGRWGKTVKAAVRIMTYIIDRGLDKFEAIEVVCEQGNHDDTTGFCLSVMLDLYYRNEPRVSIDTTYAPCHFREFGNNLIGTSHGMIKPQKLQEVMVCDQAEAWGRTKFRYWHIGHIHQKRITEVGGCVVEAFRTLAGNEAYSTAAGYRSGRDICGIVYHKEFGEIERHTAPLIMLEPDTKS